MQRSYEKKRKQATPEYSNGIYIERKFNINIAKQNESC